MRRFLTLMLAVALAVTIYPALCEVSTEESFMMDSSFNTYASKWVWLDEKNAEAIIETVVSSFQDKVEPAFAPGCGDCYFAVVNNQRCILVIPYSDSDYYIFSYDLENTDGLMKYAFHEGTKDEEGIEDSFKSLEATTYAVHKLENTERFVPMQGGQIKNSKLSMLPNTVNEWLEESSKNNTAKMLIEAFNEHLGTDYELLDGTSYLGTVGSGSDTRLCAMLKIGEGKWIYCAKMLEYPEYAIITFMDGDDTLIGLAKGTFARTVDVEPIIDTNYEHEEADSSKFDANSAEFDIMKEVTFSTKKDSIEELMNSHGYEKVKDYDAFVQVTHTLVFYNGKPIFGMPVNTVWYEYADESYDTLSRILIRYNADADTFIKVKSTLMDLYGQYEIENTGVSHGDTYVWNTDGLKICFGGALFGETIEDAEKGTAQSQISITQVKNQETNSEDIVTIEQSVSENNAFSVRGISFGMSQKQIEDIEEFALIKNEGKFITYTGTLSGIDNSNIIYNVDPIEGLLEIQYQYSSPNNIQIKKDFEKIQNALVKKYGEPLGNKNGETYTYTTSPFGAIKDLIPMLGLVDVECEYEEWWIEVKNGHVKIDHFYMCKDEEGVYNCHYLAYKFVPNDEEQDIMNDI